MIASAISLSPRLPVARSVFVSAAQYPHATIRCTANSYGMFIWQEDSNAGIRALRIAILDMRNKTETRSQHRAAHSLDPTAVIRKRLQAPRRERGRGGGTDRDAPRGDTVSTTQRPRRERQRERTMNERRDASLTRSLTALEISSNPLSLFVTLFPSPFLYDAFAKKLGLFFVCLSSRRLTLNQ